MSSSRLGLSSRSPCGGCRDSRRPFGSMRALPSGRIQVRCQEPDGLRHKAPMTFRNKTEALRWLSMMEAELARGRWDGDDSEGERLQDYATRWITERSG